MYWNTSKYSRILSVRDRNDTFLLSYGKLFIILLVSLVAGCGLRFSGAPEDTPFPPELKTIMIQSAVNNTVVTGIETELTNGLRAEFALGTRLSPVRSAGDVVLKTVISTYQDTPSTYRPDGKELTRIGTIRVNCSLDRSDSAKVLWKKEFSASHSYNVTDTISTTLSNRRQAISRMIRDIIPRIHRSMYDNF
jgi:outer membrane lipopolysaccharide assembly protein LptE/RlpB